MRLKSILLALTLPVSIGACSQQESDTAATELNNLATANGEVPGNEGMAVASSSAQEFANKAAASDRFEIESSKLAANSASSAAVKDFAAMMVKAHTDSTGKLKATLASDPSELVADDTLSVEQQAELNSLKDKKGAEFDTAYAAQQVSGHEKTLAELKNYAATGDNAGLKALAQELIPTVTEHLNKAKALK